MQHFFAERIINLEFIY